MLTMPEIRVGEPIRYEALAVFPLFQGVEGEIEYLLADEALGTGTLTIEEVGEEGSVPTLRVTNRGDQRVLFLEGEELRGAKQNRVLNTSVLIAAGSQTTIPVSCVEQGRWRYRSRQFASGGTHSSSKLRRSLKESVTQSLRDGHGHLSDQGAVWKEVARQSEALCASSPTGAMSDTFELYQDRLAEFRERLRYVEGASGVAVALGKTVVALDLFDKPSTCRKVWDRLLSGVVLDALESKAAEEVAQGEDVERLLARLRVSEWQPAPAVGDGQEFRSAADRHAHASALAFDGVLIHGSVVVDA